MSRAFFVETDMTTQSELYRLKTPIQGRTEVLVSRPTARMLIDAVTAHRATGDANNDDLVIETTDLSANEFEQITDPDKLAIVEIIDSMIDATGAMRYRPTTPVLKLIRPIMMGDRTVKRIRLPRLGAAEICDVVENGPVATLNYVIDLDAPDQPLFGLLEKMDGADFSRWMAGHADRAKLARTA